MLLVVPVEARRRKALPNAVGPARLPAADARRLSYYYQGGIKQKLGSHLSEAYDLFQHCLAISPDNPEALYELGYLHFYLGQDSVGTAMLSHAAALADNNPTYLQSLAAAHLAQRHYDEATPVLERLSKIQTRRSDVLYQLVEIYKANGKSDEALKVLDRIELLEGRTLQTSLQKYALYVDEGKQKEAYEVLESLEKEYPYDSRIPIALGRQYLQNGDSQQALACFERVRQVEPGNSDLQMAMLEYYAQTEQHMRRSALRDSLLYAPETSDDLRAQLAAQLVEDMKGEKDQRERISAVLDSLVVLSPGPLMHSMRVSYLMYAQASQDSIASAMRDLLVVDPSNETALSRLLVYYLGQQNLDNVVEICRMGVNSHPENLGYHFYLGVALSQQKQTERAVEALQNGLRQVESQSNPEYVSDIYEILGELYYEQGRADEAFAAYDSCLVYKDDNASCLNNYAYYLSLRNEQLDKAEKMSYRAIKLEPLNKTYLDTYAWVLFMQGNYGMARFYIDRVVSPSQSDSLLMADKDVHADVLEHAGDIYALNDNLEQACRYWSLALQKGGEGALLERKLKEKKYIKE